MLTCFIYKSIRDSWKLWRPHLSGNTKAERNLKVHFSIYNTKGQMIHNSFGITKLPLI